MRGTINMVIFVKGADLTSIEGDYWGRHCGETLEDVCNPTAIANDNEETK